MSCQHLIMGLWERCCDIYRYHRLNGMPMPNLWRELTVTCCLYTVSNTVLQCNRCYFCAAHRIIVYLYVREDLICLHWCSSSYVQNMMLLMTRCLQWEKSSERVQSAKKSFWCLDQEGRSKGHKPEAKRVWLRMFSPCFLEACKQTLFCPWHECESEWYACVLCDIEASCPGNIPLLKQPPAIALRVIVGMVIDGWKHF